MADYRIFETATFLEDLSNIPASDRERLRAKLTNYVYPFLRSSPRSHPQTRLLRHFHPETWRWRLGHWRAFYQINDDDRLVAMVSLTLRRDAY